MTELVGKRSPAAFKPDKAQVTDELLRAAMKALGGLACTKTSHSAQVTDALKECIGLQLLMLAASVCSAVLHNGDRGALTVARGDAKLVLVPPSETPASVSFANDTDKVVYQHLAMPTHDNMCVLATVCTMLTDAVNTDEVKNDRSAAVVRAFRRAQNLLGVDDAGPASEGPSDLGPLLARIEAGIKLMIVSPRVDVLRGTLIALVQGVLEQARTAANTEPGAAPPSSSLPSFCVDLKLPGPDEVASYVSHGPPMLAAIAARKDAGHCEHVIDFGTVAAGVKLCDDGDWFNMLRRLLQNEYLDPRAVLSVCLAVFFEPRHACVVCVSERMFDDLGLANHAGLDPACANRTLLGRKWRKDNPGFDVVRICELYQVHPFRRAHTGNSEQSVSFENTHRVLYGPSDNMFGTKGLVKDGSDLFRDCDHMDVLVLVADAEWRTAEVAAAKINGATPGVDWAAYVAVHVLHTLYPDEPLDSLIPDGAEHLYSVAKHYRNAAAEVVSEDDADESAGATGTAREAKIRGRLERAIFSVVGYLADSAVVLSAVLEVITGGGATQDAAAKLIKDAFGLKPGATGNDTNRAVVAKAMVNQRTRTAFGSLATKPRAARRAESLLARDPSVNAVGCAVQLRDENRVTEVTVRELTGHERATMLSVQTTLLGNEGLAALHALAKEHTQGGKPTDEVKAAAGTIAKAFVGVQADVLEQFLATQHINEIISDNYLKASTSNAYSRAHHDAMATPPAAPAVASSAFTANDVSLPLENRPRRAPDRLEPGGGAPPKKRRRTRKKGGKGKGSAGDAKASTSSDGEEEDSDSDGTVEGGEVHDVHRVAGYSTNVDEGTLDFLIYWGPTFGPEVCRARRGRPLRLSGVVPVSVVLFPPTRPACPHVAAVVRSTTTTAANAVLNHLA